MQKAITSCHLAATLCWTLVSVVQAQGPAPSPLISGPSPSPAQVPAVAAQPGPPSPLTKADFETFLDALIPSQLRNRNIAGAVVSVVKDGQVLFQKGDRRNRVRLIRLAISFARHVGEVLIVLPHQ